MCTLVEYLTLYIFHNIRIQSVNIQCESCSDLSLMLCCFFYRPAGASKAAYPSRIMSVLLPGALGHQSILNRHKISAMKLSIFLPFADI